MAHSDSEIVKKAIPGAIKWSASEHNYLKEMKEDLAVVRKIISNHSRGQLDSRTLKYEIDKLLNTDLRGASRSEYKLRRFEGPIEQFNLAEGYRTLQALKDLGIDITSNPAAEKIIGAVGELPKVIERIKVEGRHLVKMGSFFEGRLRDKLKEVVDAIGAYQEKHFVRGQRPENYQLSSKEAKNLVAEEKAIQNMLLAIEKDAAETDQWLTAFVSDLGRAKEIYRNAKMGSKITTKTIEKWIEGQPLDDKLEHLMLLLREETRKNLSSETNSKVIDLLERYGRDLENEDRENWALIAEHCQKAGLAEEAKKYWVKAGSCAFKRAKHQKSEGTTYEMYLNASDAYKNAGNWEKAAEAKMLMIKTLRWTRLRVFFDTALIENKEADSRFIQLVREAISLYSRAGERSPADVVGDQLMRIAKEHGSYSDEEDISYNFSNYAPYLTMAAHIYETKRLKVKAWEILRQRLFTYQKYGEYYSQGKYELLRDSINKQLSKLV